MQIFSSFLDVSPESIIIISPVFWRADKNQVTSALWGTAGDAWTPEGRLLDYSYAGYMAGAACGGDAGTDADGAHVTETYSILVLGMQALLGAGATHRMS